MFRFDTKEDPPEWKDRGVGDIRILKHTPMVSTDLVGLIPSHDDAVYTGLLKCY